MSNWRGEGMRSPSGVPAHHTPPALSPAGRVVTLIAAENGVGKTTLASNIALALRAETGQRVCLVDLDLRFGDLAAALGLSGKRHLGHWLSADEDENERLARVVTPYRPGIDCVLAPSGSGDGVRLSARVVDALLSTLSLHYDTVIVDTSTHHAAQTLAALDCAHDQLVVATPERPALRHLRFALETLDMLGYSETTRSVVLNRWDTSDEVPEAEVSATVRLPVAAYIPISRDVASSVNRSSPIVAHDPDHPVSTAIRDLVRTVLLGHDVTASHRSARSGAP